MTRGSAEILLTATFHRPSLGDRKDIHGDVKMILQFTTYKITRLYKYTAKLIVPDERSRKLYADSRDRVARSVSSAAVYSVYFKRRATVTRLYTRKKIEQYGGCGSLDYGA